jgi:cytochrome c
MDAFEFNKIAGAFLASMLLILVLHMFGDALFEPAELEHAAFIVEVPDEGATAAVEEEAPPLGVLLASADIEAGKKVAKKCRSCHTFKQAGKNKVGPNLWNILGAVKAQVAGFSYSGAMADAGGQWGYAELDTFLANPKGMIKGTKMTFVGLKKAHDRANLIAYLRILSNSPLALPAAE